MWQDYALASINVAFCVTLVPMLFTREKPPLSSSIPTGVLLLTGAGILATLHLWLAVATQTIVGLQWLTFAFQRMSRSQNAPGA